MLKSIDFNVYSMDSVEFRKTTHKDDDLDYVQKNIRWEQIDELSIAIFLSQTMQLRGSNPVTPHAYRLSPDENGNVMELYDEELTLRLKANFSFDTMRREAKLTVQRPAPWTAYRISWRLGPPSAPPPTPAVQAMADQNRRTLLSFRPLFDGTGIGDTVGEAKKKAVLQALALFGAQAVAEVNRSLAEVKPGAQAEIDLTQLDLSVMAVQRVVGPNGNYSEVLRVVAGLNVPAVYWSFELAMGDGIAGRAAKVAGRDKRIQFRRFRRDMQDSMLNDAYLRFDSNRPQHDWLLSIPLHEECCDPIPYGVLNLGAFDQQNAGLLNALSDSSIEVLENYANGDFLRKVLNAVG